MNGDAIFLLGLTLVGGIVIGLLWNFWSDSALRREANQAKADLARAKDAIASRDLSIAAVEANCRKRDGEIRLLKGDLQAANNRIASMKPDYELGVSRRRAIEKQSEKKREQRAAAAK